MPIIRRLLSVLWLPGLMFSSSVLADPAAVSALLRQRVESYVVLAPPVTPAEAVPAVTAEQDAGSSDPNAVIDTTTSSGPTTSSGVPVLVTPPKPTAPVAAAPVMRQPPLVVAGVTLNAAPELGHFYAERNYQSAWLTAQGGLAAPADALLQALAASADEGLRAEDYHYPLINTRIAALRQTPASDAAQAELDLLLSDAFLEFTRHLLHGRVGERKVDKEWKLPLREADRVALLKQAVDGQLEQALQQARPQHPEYARLTRTLHEYRVLAARGGWPKVSNGPKLTLGARGERVRELRARLRASNDFAAAALATSRDDRSVVAASTTGLQKTANRKPAAVDDSVFDRNLNEAVKHFQRRHGMDDDGVVGAKTVEVLNVSVEQRIQQIEANLERLRWMPQDFGPRYIKVDLTGFMMYVLDHDKVVYSDKIVVGMTDRPTPVFTANMSYLVFSPYWHVPRSIAVQDKLPKLQQDAYALSRQGIRIFNRDGQEVDPGLVDWTGVGRNNFPFRLRQDPGSRNALGRVKFMLPNPYNIYLHDTPSRHLFARAERTYSSGCIRVARPVELATFLLSDKTRWTREAVEAAYNGSRQQSVQLSEELPVVIQYWTAWPDENGAVQFRKDIYGRDAALINALFPKG